MPRYAFICLEGVAPTLLVFLRNPASQTECNFIVSKRSFRALNTSCLEKLLTSKILLLNFIDYLLGRIRNNPTCFRFGALQGYPRVQNCMAARRVLEEYRIVWQLEGY